MTAPPSSDLDRYLDLEGARIRYRDAGSGPAILLVHGWTLDLEMWNPTVERLREQFRLIRLDRRGHGRSSGVAGSDQDAADLAQVCRLLQLERVAVIGMSQGTRSALVLASRAQELVRALILDGTPDLRPRDGPGDLPLAHFQAILRYQGVAAFRREWRAQQTMQLRSRDPAIHELLAAVLERYAGRDLDDLGAAGAARPQFDFGTIKAPVLILNGEFDLETRSSAADYLCQQLPRAQRHLIGEAGHLPNLDNPDAYAQVCRDFLSRQLDGSAWR